MSFSSVETGIMDSMIVEFLAKYGGDDYDCRTSARLRTSVGRRTLTVLIQNQFRLEQFCLEFAERLNRKRRHDKQFRIAGGGVGNLVLPTEYRRPNLPLTVPVVVIAPADSVGKQDEVSWRQLRVFRIDSDHGLVFMPYNYR